MIIASLMCCVNIDSSNEWLGPASTVVVALVGLCSGVIIAKLSSHLELRKTLCLRKVEVYESAMRQLVLKINIYANFLNTLRGAVDSSTLEMRLGLMAAVLAQLPQVEQNDADVARFGPLAETEYNQQQAIFAKLKKDITSDRLLRKLLRAGE